ncbi:hypothetical protein QUB80_30100 [Chlorogloeopsis sp. ULAP01]|uniref:hypothetical protein n=1 Tax=Chlorogloeopsis sp. ULAP01 TaxID=3056483 RepID=UPI0025AAC414|nr:hypothetical protein [Chlorogloeopsis sp. ULAP01]MDM9384914.1 hypothetical protein [Chlorogloeopsis sp. ULAP01]
MINRGLFCFSISNRQQIIQILKDALNIKKLTTKDTLDVERLLTLREAGQSPSTEATTLP